MKKIVHSLLYLVLIAVILVASGVIYIIDETEQVVITQFGEPIGRPITEAGLYFKIPGIQIVNRFEKRLLRWDGSPDQFPTLEKQYLSVDTTARWRISDALKFMQAVGSEKIAHTRLDDVVEAATRDTISNLNFIESVKNSNAVSERLGDAEINTDVYGGMSSREIKNIKVGREKLTRMILDRAAGSVPKYGIELIDVRIKRINYIKEDRKAVYERMISERKQAAEKYRSEGQGEKARIEGDMVKELEQIRSEAYKKAQKIKGKADAEAIKIYAAAYNKDPEFYSFIKTLESYKETLGSDTVLMLSTDSEFFRYLESVNVKSIP